MCRGAKEAPAICCCWRRRRLCKSGGLIVRKSRRASTDTRGLTCAQGCCMLARRLLVLAQWPDLIESSVKKKKKNFLCPSDLVDFPTLPPHILFSLYFLLDFIKSTRNACKSHVNKQSVRFNSCCMNSVKHIFIVALIMFISPRISYVCRVLSILHI